MSFPKIPINIIAITKSKHLAGHNPFSKTKRLNSTAADHFRILNSINPF